MGSMGHRRVKHMRLLKPAVAKPSTSTPVAAKPTGWKPARTNSGKRWGKKPKGPAAEDEVYPTLLRGPTGVIKRRYKSMTIAIKWRRLQQCTVNNFMIERLT